MKIETERLSEKVFTPPWVLFEHEARYRFAAQFVEGKNVADCACGSGIGAKMFVDAQAKHVFAYDIDEKSITKAVSKYHSTNLSFDCANVCSLPLPENAIDVVVSLETIEHLPDDTGFLSEVTRTLKPDGLFICSTPNRTVTNPGSSFTDKPWNKFHCREYAIDEFVTLLGKYFMHYQLYGQSIIGPNTTKIRNCLAACFSSIVAVRFGQILKLPRFIMRSPEKHQVVPYENGCQYEYVVACCKNPIK